MFHRYGNRNKVKIPESSCRNILENAPDGDVVFEKAIFISFRILVFYVIVT